MHRASDSQEAQLEALAQDMVNAINNRIFDPNSWPWSSTTSDYTAEVAWTTTPQKTDLTTYLASCRKVAVTSPNARLNVVDMTVSVGRGTGNVFVNQEWHDAPSGIVRPSIAFYDFVHTGTEWKCTRYRCLPGINPRAGLAAISNSGWGGPSG